MSHVPKYTPKAFIAGVARIDEIEVTTSFQNSHKPKDFNDIRQYKCYDSLERNDLVITIEHCHNCGSHQVSTKHDPKAYVIKANSALQMLAQYLYNLKVSCRVGLARFQANVLSSSFNEKSRIGAFEVQIAYRDPNNQLHIELLHSKLDTKVWLSNSGTAVCIYSFDRMVMNNLPQFIILYLYLYLSLFYIIYSCKEENSKFHFKNEY